MNDIHSKKIQPFYKSEYLNEEENSHLLVKKIVSKNYYDLVLESNKSVLVLFWSSRER